jgi:hypothetical protein
MAQNIILKRSALSGKVPDTGSLNLGEIAINTYDGKAFIHKSGSSESIEQIVVTNSTTTGSITITQTGSFGEINVTNDINVSGSVYVTTDIVVNGDADVLGAVSASVVSASMYYGDGSQLTGISAGTTDSEIPTNDWDYNLPDSGTLSDGNNQSTKYTIDFQAESYGTRPLGYQTFISNTDGSTEIIPGTDSIVFIVNDLEVGRIDEGGIIGNTPLGTISGSVQLTASFDARYALSASYLTSLDGAISSSSQILNGSGIISGAAQLPVGIISGSSQLTSSYDSRYVLETETGSLATTGSNTFTGLQTFQQIQEVISLKPSLGLGTNNFDFNSGSIFYIAGLTGSGTWNVQNIPSASNAATSLTFVIQQGGTAYSASVYQLGGTAVSVKWLDGTIPTGSANATDVIGLTAFRSGSSWNVIGSLSKFS